MGLKANAPLGIFLYKRNRVVQDLLTPVPLGLEIKASVRLESRRVFAAPCEVLSIDHNHLEFIRLRVNGIQWGLEALRGERALWTRLE